MGAARMKAITSIFPTDDRAEWDDRSETRGLRVWDDSQRANQRVHSDILIQDWAIYQYHNFWAKAPQPARIILCESGAWRKVWPCFWSLHGSKKSSIALNISDRDTIFVDELCRNRASTVRIIQPHCHCQNHLV